MGSVTVLSSLGEGYYRVRIHFDNFRIDQRLAAIQSELDGLPGQLKELEDKKIPLETALHDAKLEMDRYARTATPKELVSNQSTMNALVEKVFKAQVALTLAENDIKRLKLKKTSLEKEKVYLEKNCPGSIETHAWCIEYNEELDGDMESIEVDYLLERDPITDQLRNDTGVWLPGVKKTPSSKLQHVLATSSFATWFNLCVAPAMQRYKGRYRIATLSGLDDPANGGTKCNLEFIGRYDVDRFSQKVIGDKPILPNFTTEDGTAQQLAYHGADIRYMDSDAAAFENGDKVIVDLHQGKGVPTVIGFYSNPRKVETGSVLVWPVSDSAPNGWGQPFTGGNDPGTIGGPHPGVLMTYSRPPFASAGEGFRLQRGYLAAGADPVAGNCYWSNGSVILTWDGPWSYQVAPDPARAVSDDVLALGYTYTNDEDFKVYHRWGRDLYKGGVKYSGTGAYVAPPRPVLGAALLNKNLLVAVCLPANPSANMGEVFYKTLDGKAWLSGGDIPYSPPEDHTLLAISHIFSFSEDGTQAASIRYVKYKKTVNGKTTELGLKTMMTRLNFNVAGGVAVSFAASHTDPDAARYTASATVHAGETTTSSLGNNTGVTYIGVGYNKNQEIAAYLKYSKVNGSADSFDSISVSHTDPLTNTKTLSAVIVLDLYTTGDTKVGTAMTFDIYRYQHSFSGYTRLVRLGEDYQFVSTSEASFNRRHETNAVLFWDIGAGQRIVLNRVSQTARTMGSSTRTDTVNPDGTGGITDTVVESVYSNSHTRKLVGLDANYEVYDNSETPEDVYLDLNTDIIVTMPTEETTFYAPISCANPLDVISPTVKKPLVSMAYGVVDARLGLVAHAYTHCPTSATAASKHAFNIILRDRTKAGLALAVEDYTPSNLLTAEEVLGVYGDNVVLANTVRGIARI